MHSPEAEVIKHVVTYRRAVSIRCADPAPSLPAPPASAAAAADSDGNSAIASYSTRVATVARFAAGIT